MKNKGWLVHFGIGFLFLGLALHYLINLPLFREPSNWNWLTQDPQVIDFININFQVQGIWLLGYAFFVIITAATGYRGLQQWAWYALWIVPLTLIMISFIMPWLLAITLILIVVSAAALLVSRPTFFVPQNQPV